MSFSDLLKQKTSITNEKMNIATMSIPSSTSAPVMTLAETGNMIAAYAGDDFTKSDKYLWYDEYYDDEYSTIDKQKNIVLNKNQVNLTQEENSQVIPFMLDRYFDGMDLMKMLFQIHFVNKNATGSTRNKPLQNIPFPVNTALQLYFDTLPYNTIESYCRDNH